MEQLNQSSTKLNLPIMDIEDLASTLKDKKICPFYFSRDIQSDADIIFVPYNYLVDPSVRKSLGVSIENAILIFDEAHNVEGVASDAASFSLSSVDITGGIKEITKCSQAIAEGNFLAGEDNMLNKQSVSTLKSLLLEIEKGLYAFNLSPKNGLTKPGEFIFEFFRQFNINFDTCSLVMTMIEQVIEALGNDATSSNSLRSTKLEALLSFLKRIFRDKAEFQKVSNYCAALNDSSILLKMSKNFRVHIHESKESIMDEFIIRPMKKTKFSSLANALENRRNIRIFSYWCFYPGVSMREIASQSVYNIILTSGTLSPLESTENELGLDFKVRLENSHTIDKGQVWVGVVGTGVTGKRLNSSYRYRNVDDSFLELGNTIINFTRMIPNGLLVFFPSYSNLESCIEKWKETNPKTGLSIWNRISKLKEAFVEPRDKVHFKEIVDNYADCIKSNKAGAVFFAVCRGKVSEGIDFSDENARAVVITGLPFAPTRDPKIILKKSFLDESPSIPGKMKLTGNEWYVQQASRAVNQAIGRVIRHRHDYGAIILCDERFNSPQQQNSLSKWIQPFCHSYKSYGECHRSLTKFFKECRARDSSKPLPQPSKAPTFAVNSEKNRKEILNDESTDSDAIDADGQTYINPIYLQQPRSPTSSSQKRPSLDTIDFKRKDRSDKPASLASVFKNPSTMSSSTSSLSEATDTAPDLLCTYTTTSKLSSKYSNGPKDADIFENYNPSSTTSKSITSKQFKPAFGLSLSQERIQQKEKNASDMLSLARSLLNQGEVNKLYNLLKRLKTSPSESEEIIAELVDFLTERGQELLHLLPNFFNAFQLRLFKMKTETLPFIKPFEGKSILQTLQKMEKSKKRKAAHISNVYVVDNPQCLICLSLPEEPYASPCGHICCVSCWRKLFIRERKCPVCKVEILKNQLKPIKAAKI